MSSMSFSNDAYPRQSRPFMSFWEIGTDKGIFGLRGIFPYHVYDTGKTGLAFSDRSALSPLCCRSSLNDALFFKPKSENIPLPRSGWEMKALSERILVLKPANGKIILRFESNRLIL